MASKRGIYSREFREAAVREVIDKSRPIAVVARENGLVAQTLGNWVSAWRVDHAGEEPELSLTLVPSGKVNCYFRPRGVERSL
mgnify:CR=1 FL=1